MEPTRPDYWTGLRLELRSWFTRNAPSLGELYKGAVEMVFNNTFPGRVRFVTYAVNEIRNRLPDVIAGPIIGGQIHYEKRLDNIVRVWKAHGLPIDGSLPMTMTEEVLPTSSPNNEVSLPPIVYVEIAQLIKDHEQSKIHKDVVKRTFEAINLKNSEEQKAVLTSCVIHWLDVTNWFAKFTYDQGEMGVDIDGEELKGRFENFEYALWSLVKEF